MTSASRAAAWVVALGLLAVAAPPSARAAVTFTDLSNITVTNRQVESGGDTSGNPSVVNGPVGERVPYTPPNGGYCCDERYGPPNFDDDDIGTGVPSDGFYAIPNEGRLNFDFPFPTAPPILVGSIAIYYGYGNRADGNYVLKGGLIADTTLGAWTISGTDGATNDGVDSFWLTFNTPVRTATLTLIATGVENGTPSFRELDVFAPVPEPASSALLGAAGLTYLCRRRRRLPS
jgi:hypothetical protein